jgi:DNA-binding response OmpR family regulator
VLVVDDEAAIRQLLKEALAAEGYVVEVCSDGRQAWERLLDRQSGFDLLITDQTMPHMTGLELIGRLRAEGNTLPAVLCTGFSELVNEHVLQELNIEHSLQKPVRLDQLKSTLRTLLLARGSGQDRPLSVGSAKH